MLSVKFYAPTNEHPNLEAFITQSATLCKYRHSFKLHDENVAILTKKTR